MASIGGNNNYPFNPSKDKSCPTGGAEGSELNLISFSAPSFHAENFSTNFFRGYTSKTAFFGKKIDSIEADDVINPSEDQSGKVFSQKILS